MKLQSGLVPRLRRSARSLLDRPRAELRPAASASVSALKILLSCLRKLWRDRAAEMAAGLAFQTLFSLLPLLVLALIVLNSVRGLEDASAEMRNMIVEFLVPQGLAELDPDQLGSPAANGSGAALDPFDQARGLLRRRLDYVLDQLSQVSFAGIGVVGFLFFLYGSTALMRTIESSFDLLYDADAPRPWSRLPLYFTLLTLGPVALVAAQMLQDRLLADLEGAVGGWFATAAAWTAPLIVTCLLLTLAIRALPNTWVSWRAAAIGGLWSGGAWFAFQEIFGAYVDQASMTSLYGALALLPLFLLWIYWSWVLILGGVALAFVIQHRDAEYTWATAGPVLPGDPRWLVPIMARVGESFARGETMTASRLSHELRLPPRILRSYLRLLERGDMVRALRDGGGEHVLTVTRPLHAIAVKDLLALEPPTGSAVASQVLEQLHHGELEAVGDLTLEDVVSRPDAVAPRDCVDSTGEPR